MTCVGLISRLKTEGATPPAPVPCTLQKMKPRFPTGAFPFALRIAAGTAKLPELVKKRR